MNWNDFFQSLKSDSLAPVYLFTGPEEYVKREALAALRKKLLPAGLEALNEMDLENATAQQITDAAETMPVMCDRRLVVVRDWAPLMQSKSKNEDKEVQWMQNWLENPPESCVLVFYLRAGDGSAANRDNRRPAATKMLTLLRKKAEAVDFDLLNPSELARWSSRYLRPHGKKISAGTLHTLTYMAGQDLTRLSLELDKLVDYVGEKREEITAEDVRAIVPASLEYRIFELMDCLLSGDMLKAQQIVNNLLQGGQSCVGILATLTRQVRRLAHMKSALDAGNPAQAVQDQLKLNPGAVRPMVRQCSRLSAGWLTGIYERCVEMDFAVKSGRLRDTDALSAIMLQIGLAGQRNS